MKAGKVIAMCRRCCPVENWRGRRHRKARHMPEHVGGVVV
jgi:hypothetical protein